MASELFVAAGLSWRWVEVGKRFIVERGCSSQAIAVKRRVALSEERAIRAADEIGHGVEAKEVRVTKCGGKWLVIKFGWHCCVVIWAPLTGYRICALLCRDAI